MYGTQNDHRIKAILRKKKQIRYVTVPGFKLYYEVIIIKIVWSLHKYRLMEGFPGGSGLKKKKKPSLLTKAGDVKDPSLITG